MVKKIKSEMKNKKRQKRPQSTRKTIRLMVVAAGQVIRKEDRAAAAMDLTRQTDK